MNSTNRHRQWGGSNSTGRLKTDPKVREPIDNSKSVKDLEFETCRWDFNLHCNSYDTECGGVFIISEDPIILNYDFKFCPFCGKKMSKKV